MDPQPQVTIGVECRRDGSAQAIPAQQTRAVYFPTDDLPYLIFLCPGCNDAHKIHTDVNWLDEIRAGGAASDYPDIPDDPGSNLAVPV